MLVVCICVISCFLNQPNSFSLPAPQRMCSILDLHSHHPFATVSLTYSVTLALPSNKRLHSKTGNIIKSVPKTVRAPTIECCVFQRKIIDFCWSIQTNYIIAVKLKLNVDFHQSVLRLLFLQASVVSSRDVAHPLPYDELARAFMCLSHSQKCFYQTGGGWRTSNTGELQPHSCCS